MCGKNEQEYLDPMSNDEILAKIICICETNDDPEYIASTIKKLLLDEGLMFE